MRDLGLMLKKLARRASEGFPCWRVGLIALVLLVVSAARANEPVRVLVVNGSGTAGTAKGGDTYYLDTVLKSVKGYAPAVKDPAELEKAELKSYPLVFLLNVPELSETARKNLEEHVKAGGGAAFFLGDRVKATHYNRFLYRKGEGIFPVALPNRATDARDEKQKSKDKADQLRTGRPTVYVREPRHAVCADLTEMNAFLALLDIDRYFAVTRGKGAAASRLQ